MRIVPKIKEYNNSLYYQRLIIESLSVSDRVEKVSEYIFNEINNNNNNLITIENVDFIGRLKILLTTTKNTVGYVEEGEFYTDNMQIIDGKLYGIRLKLTVFIDDNNKMVNENNIFSIIYHEIEHIYQSFCILSKTIKETPTDLYNFALENVHSKNSCVRDISWVFYMLYTGEQDAYVNGLFKTLLSNKKISKDNILSYYKETFEYEILLHLKDIYKRMSNWNLNNGGECEEMVKQLNNEGIPFELNRITLMLNKTIKRFENKIGKVITKVLKRKNLVENNKIIWRWNLKNLKIL